jgi:hypothetical protein
MNATSNANYERLYDLAEVMRSKNAGPLHLTLDIIFPEQGSYRRVVDSGVLTPALVSGLYDVPAGEIQIVTFDDAENRPDLRRARRSRRLRRTAARTVD